MDILENYGKPTSGEKYAEAHVLLTQLLESGRYAARNGGLQLVLEAGQQMPIESPETFLAALSDELPAARCDIELARKVLDLARVRAAKLDAARRYHEALKRARHDIPEHRPVPWVEGNIAARVEQILRIK